MIKPNKYTNIDLSVINIGGVILKSLASCPIQKYNELEDAVVSSYGSSAKVVFLNAFATWCGPCRYEMPDIEALYEKYKESSDVVILGVAFPSQSNEGNASYIRSFLSDGGYTYPVLMDPKGILSSVFSIRAFPTTVVFGKDGEVVSYVPGALSGEYMEKLITDALEK